MTVTIRSVLAGRVVPFGPRGEPSGFRKTAVAGPVSVGALGLAGDEQADQEHHGGRDKAILHYAFDHYALWREERPELAAQLARPGAFGENISTCGLTENEVCIGDRYRLGSATVEVSQGRQPCWKLGHRFREPAMVGAVVLSGRGGWYYRVVEPGEVAAGDALELLERPWPEWPVARVFGLIVGPDRDPEALEALSTLVPLGSSWQAKASRRRQNLAAR
jgi:MOSC domain-containing protein YiiM